MKKQFATVMLVLSSTMVLAGRPAGAETTSCTVNLPEVQLSPGLSTEGSSGVFHSTAPGTINCQGRQGTIRADGRYGTSGPATCQGGGEGWGTMTYSFDNEAPIYDTFTITFGANKDGTNAGEVQGERLSGSYLFTNTKGNCVTEPVTVGSATMPSATLKS